MAEKSKLPCFPKFDEFHLDINQDMSTELHELREFDIQLNDKDEYSNNDVNTLNNVDIEIISLDENEIEFDIKNVDVSIVNALRRILLSEIPTISIEKVLIENNTSVIQDEVLAGRLGLIPIKVDPDLLSYHKGSDIEANEDDTLVFELKVKCSKNESTKLNTDSSNKYNYVTKNVYSSHLKWVPIGNQLDKFKFSPPCSIHENILIAKLNPGQEIDLKVHCHKGIGKDHAKYSPVATAAYRLRPSVILKQRIFGDMATKLQSYFSPGVIKLIPCNNNNVEAVVGDTRNESMSFNICRDKDLKDLVEIGRVPNHFIFKVESVGSMPPEILVKKAIQIMMDKCNYFIQELEHTIS